MKGVARTYGISVTPVRMAFAVLEREGLVYRRHGLGTFVGDAPTIVPSTLCVGVLFRAPSGWSQQDNYGLRLFHGIQEGLREAGHRTLLVTTPDKQYEVDEVPSQFADHPVHGYILDERVSDGVVEALSGSGKPTVVVNRECRVHGVGSVFRDNEQAGAEAARRMIEASHRVVACISRNEWNCRQATRAFLKAMGRAGCAVPPDRAAMTYRGKPYEPVFEQVLYAVPTPTAVYAATDRIAYWLSQFVRKAGLRMPEDISIVGLLDLAMARRAEPPLTTFRFDPEQIGRMAVQELIERCRDPKRAARSHRVPGRWIERGSLARLSGRSPDETDAIKGTPP